MKTIKLTDDQFDTLFHFVDERVEDIVDRSVQFQDSEILEDQEIHKIWNIIDNALERQGYNADNGELSIRVYDDELIENIEHNYLDSLSEGKDQPNDYGSKVDALVDSMGVTVNKAAQGHVRKDLDQL